MLAGVAGIAALSLFSCSKDQKTADQLVPQSSNTAGARTTGTDELDAILKDLSPETYLLTFDGLPANNYITKTRYGTFSDEEFCGTPPYPFPIPGLAGIGYRAGTPFSKIWIKVCPIFIPFKDVAARVAAIMQKADPKAFADLTVTEIGTNQQLLATKSFLTAANRLQPDAVDKALSGQNLKGFRLTLPAGTKLPAFTRGFYGIGNIDQIPDAGGARVISKYVGLKWKDILGKRFPNLIGCFDPIIMKDIRAQLTRIDKSFATLNIEEVANGAVLGF